MLYFSGNIFFILRSIPLTIYQITFASIIITGEIKYWIFAFGMLISELINRILKYLIKNKRPSRKGIENGRCTGCGVIPKYNNFSDSFGMPSGHAQLAGYIGIFWSLFLFRKELNNVNRYFPPILSIFILCIFSLSISWSRINNNCHNKSQVFFGIFLGIVIGIITYNKGSQLYPGVFN